MKKHKLPVWKNILRNNFTRWQQLAEFLNLSDESRLHIDQLARFPLNLPLRLAEKIGKNDLSDPILKQFLPTLAERTILPEFVADPTGDATFQTSDRLLQKYKGRALMVATGACAMHCRYCFRQNFSYPTTKAPYDKVLETVASDTSLKELILSGGDPLSLMDDALERLFKAIDAIPHVTRLRIHTRFPVGIPERIDDSFLQILQSSTKQVWFVTHVNHPRELDDDVLAALRRIQRLGIPVLNQSVLLKGVNDDLPTLQALSEKLIDHGLLPYYLHQLDRVAGAAHFEVSEREGLQLIEGLKGNLSGYGVPKYVKEIAGETSKTTVRC